MPSAICARMVASLGSRTCWNGVRIRASDVSEAAYEQASTTNGSDRAMPNRNPPSGGPARLTIAIRAVTVETASGSCVAGTTERSAPVAATVKATLAEPSINATTPRRANDASPIAIDAARTPIVVARTRSAATIMRRRSNRSAASPAGSWSTAKGARRANATTPARAGEWVSASASSG
jgi:hypothetical protein